MGVNSRDDGGHEGGAQTQGSIPNPNPSSPRTRGFKAKSCKGIVYYSSVRKSKSKNPTCVGFPRTLQQVPPNARQTSAAVDKEGRAVSYFKYACAGYSVYLDSSADPQDEPAKFPNCTGLQAIMYEDPSLSAGGHTPAPAEKNEGREHALPQTQSGSYKPSKYAKEEYLNRFIKNANLVASGVVRNLCRVGDYVKDTLDDILYPHRRRPK